ncbi:protein yipf5 [Phtheirospermum japonicum]|uniref:Protein yipf5 n=1 Tax=Phtheirospermum japonicum TaxID=374723 RepID=A0A830CN57_9LAMI|nr:protein yipf5 [Phtheirospermum japonicum]
MPLPRLRRLSATPLPHRLLPTPRSSNPGLLFLSFDVNSAAASASFTSAPQFPSTIGGGGGSAGFEDEPSLLKELGINIKQIYQKTLSIVNPFRINYHLHEDANLSGPFLFLIAFGLFQRLAGQLHFGIILRWVTMASMFLYVVFNMLAGKNGNLDMYKCLSLIGYCMLPIVMLSTLSLFLPQGGCNL